MSMTKKKFSTIGIRCVYKLRIINFIFSYFGNVQSKVFNSYFSYHKPIVSFLEYDTNDDEADQNLPE